MEDSKRQTPAPIVRCHNDWRRNAENLQIILIILGVIALLSSFAVLTFTEELKPTGTRLFTGVSALSIGFLSFFQIQKKVADYWSGWKYLNGPMILYENGNISLEMLLDKYEKAEMLVGVMESNAAILRKLDSSE